MMDKETAPPLWQSARIRWLLVFGCICLMMFSAIEFAFPIELRGKIFMVDYHAFYVAGRMFWEGHLSDAYRAEALFVAQQRIVGGQSFMPWTYPPHFNFITAGLALVPVWLGYALFISISFAAYFWATKRLAGSQHTFVILALFPAILACIRTGQSGLLVGALMAGSMLLLLAGRASAGVPLALLTIKPHFLPAIGLYLLLRGQWRVITVGALVTLALALAATAAFGAGIWNDFLGAVGEAGGFLTQGLYPLYRMTSLYAALFMLGMAPDVAMVLQIALGLCWLGLLVLASRAGWPPRHLLATAVIGSLFLSPYAYDYDLPIFGVAVALLAADLTQRASSAQLSFFILLAWVTSGISLIFSLSASEPTIATREFLLARPPSLGVFGLLPLGLFALWIVRRPVPADAP